MTEKTPTIESLMREYAALREQSAREIQLRDTRVVELSRELSAKQRAIEQLEQRIQSLLRRLFGRSSEKIHPGQLLLPGLEDKDEPLPPHANEAADDEATVQETRPRRRKSRKARLKDLPRIRIEHDVEAADKVCACGQDKQRIGEETRDEIEYVPSSVFVKEHVRPKHACRTCQDGVVIAPLPSLLIERGLPGPGLLAQIVTAKFADHLPLHRQEAIFERHGLALSRKTMCDWIGVVYELLQPILLAMRRELLARKVVQSDDTPVLMQAEDIREGVHAPSSGSTAPAKATSRSTTSASPGAARRRRRSSPTTPETSSRPTAMPPTAAASPHPSCTRGAGRTDGARCTNLSRPIRWTRASSWL